VKIRGFQIELGEVEAALRGCRQVGEAVVIAREDVPGDKRLTGYVTAAAGGEVDVPAGRGALRERLPEYMLPAAVIVPEAIPLTANGQVDKRALPAPDGTRPELTAAYTSPQGPVESVIARIWSEVLGIDRIGVHDNFFELGGDSILGIQVVSKARRLGLALTPRMMFQYQSVAQLAANIDAASPTHDTATPDRYVVSELNVSNSPKIAFCFLEAGGNTSGYLPLAQSLREEARFIGIEPTWRDHQKMPHGMLSRWRRSATPPSSLSNGRSLHAAGLVVRRTACAGNRPLARICRPRNQPGCS